MCRNNSRSARLMPILSASPRIPNVANRAPSRRLIGPRALILTAVACIAFTLGLGALRPLAANAQSGATTYSTSQRIFKVGILLVESTRDPVPNEARGPENPDPYVFYIADQRTDLKPGGWSFINPLAPATVTEAVKSRWDARMGGNNTSGYQIGHKVVPNMAAYWEVSLTDTPISQLIQFDMLFITNHRATNFHDADREKLRKLVDAGGVIWMEDCGGMQIVGGAAANAKGSFFLDGVQFEGNGFGNFQTSGPAVYQPTHPLLTTPYQLTLSELSNLGDKNYGNFHVASYLGGSTGQTGQPNTFEAMPNPDALVDIVGNTGSPKDPATGQYLPYIAAGHYGSGSVLLTAGDLGCDINDYVGGSNAGSGGNSGSICGTTLSVAHAEDLKFLYNTVAWGSANNGYRRNNRRTAASFESIGAPLLSSFDFASLYRTAAYSPGGDRVKSKTAPLIANGLMFVSGLDTSAGDSFSSGGNWTLRCYDTQPFRDYDGDGNYDDGLPDVSLGLSYDEVWRFQGTKVSLAGGAYEQPSPPILASVVGAATVLGATVPADKIFVTAPDGGLYIFPAAKNLGGGSIPPNIAAADLITVPADASGGSYDALATHGVAPAPVVYGEVVYQIEPDGQLRAINITNGIVMWRSFPDGGAPYIITPTATPTVGFSQYTANTRLAKNSENTTNDLMLYVPVQISGAGAGGAGTRAQILAYWLGTRNEVQRFTANTDGQGNGNTAIIDSRVAGGGGSTLGGALYVAPGFPFIAPTVRVYSGTDPANMQANYEAGTESTFYTGAFQLDSNGNPGGQVLITPVNGGAPPGLLPKYNANIEVSISYDVMYVSPAFTPNVPVNYNAVNQIGARVDPNLNIPNYVSKVSSGFLPPQADLGVPGGGMDTLTMSADDLLLFSADQGHPALPNLPHITSMFAIHEQMSATQLLWRYGLHDSGNADGFASGQAITDGAPIFNYNRLTVAAGTLTLSSTQPSPLPEFISGLAIVGPPVTTNSGLTYVVAAGTSGPSTRNGGGGVSDGVNPNGMNQGPVTVLMCFQSNPTITLTLPISFEATAPVTISQVSALDNSVTISAGAQNADGSAQLSIDAQRGKVTIINFNGTGGQFSASQSFVVSVTPIGQTTPVRYVVHPLPPAASGATYLQQLGFDETGTISADSGGFTPMQWYYVLPGQPTSGPTLIGDYLFFNMTPTVTFPGGGAQSGPNCLAAVDANPAANDAAVRVGFGEPILNVGIHPAPFANTVNHLRWLSPLSDQSQPGNAVNGYAPPVGSQGVMAVNSNIGTFAFGDQKTLIADGSRLVEVGADGTASWTLSATQIVSVPGGDLPIYGRGGNLLNGSPGNLPTGRSATTTQTLSHPTVARKIGNGDYLIADSGNNRVIRVDRGGLVSWNLDTIDDPYGLMAGSDPKNLSGPTDVQYYIAPSPGGGYEAHYLVADPGNFRVIEVADYFNPKGIQIDSPYPHKGNTAATHSLVWTTRTQSNQGQRLAYTNVQRFLGVDPSNSVSGYPYVIATVGATSVGGATSSGGADFTGGALVSLNYGPYSTGLPMNSLANGASAVKTIWPNDGNTPPKNEPLANGTILASANDLRETIGSQTFGSAGNITATKSNPTGFNIRRLAHPAYFTEVTLPNAAANPPTVRNIYLICDSNAVYAVEATVDNLGNAVRDVLWKFTQADYDILNIGRLGLLTPRGAIVADPSLLPRFVPSSVKLLPNGDFLITNSYFGRSPLFQSGQFNGEVFQVTPNTTPGSALAAGATYTPSFGAFSLFTAASSIATAEGGTYGQFSTPKIVNSSVAPPIFVQQMGATNNTSLLEQPLFSERQ